MDLRIDKLIYVWVGSVVKQTNADKKRRNEKVISV